MGTMICPHCQAVIDDNWNTSELGVFSSGKFDLQVKQCIACERPMLRLEIFWKRVVEPPYGKGREYLDHRPVYQLIYPRTSSRPPAQPEVPLEFAKDFNEACLVLDDSPNASAALSRRCLQNLIRHHEGIKKDNLYREIEALLDKGHLPSHITDDLHTIRDAGNVAAHPWKDSDSGLIVDVEPEEAELLLNVLESMFDFYFVQPAKAAARRAKLQEKVEEAEK
jgi:hypothetical protein